MAPVMTAMTSRDRDAADNGSGCDCDGNAVSTVAIAAVGTRWIGRRDERCERHHDCQKRCDDFIHVYSASFACFPEGISTLSRALFET